MSNEQTAIVAYEPHAAQQQHSMSIVTPLIDPMAAALAIRQYEQLKAAIVQPTDMQVINGRTFLKKAFWRRVATCFGLSLELVREERVMLDNRLTYRVIYRAIAPNGRTMDADGMCQAGEKGQMIEHNIRAIAHTRAKNRAISDLVGGGEVSAEEMQEHDPKDTPPAIKRPPAVAAPSTHVPDDEDAEYLSYESESESADPESESTPDSEPPTALQLRRIESLCKMLGKDFDASKIRDTQHAEHIRIELDRQYAAKVNAVKAAVNKRGRAPHSGRSQVSPLAETLEPGEEAPDLATLGTGGAA